MNHLTEETLILLFYSEAEDAGTCRGHLAACPTCRERWTRLQQTMAAISASPVPARAPGYGERLWDRIQPAILAEAAVPRRTVFQARSRIYWVAGLAAALVLAFLAGFFSARPPVHPAAPGRNLIWQTAVLDHLDRAQLLLLEIDNAAETGEGFQTRTQARSLVLDNRLLRLTAAGNEQEVGS